MRHLGLLDLYLGGADKGKGGADKGAEASKGALIVADDETRQALQAAYLAAQRSAKVLDASKALEQAAAVAGHGAKDASWMHSSMHAAHAFSPHSYPAFGYAGHYAAVDPRAHGLGHGAYPTMPMRWAGSAPTAF